MSGNEESTSLYNPLCANAKYPADGKCENGWKYFNGNDWMDDVTMSIFCTIQGGNIFLAYKVII